MIKPSKKSTVEDLRSGLANAGLDTSGKKETLFRRLINYFNRNKHHQSTLSPSSTPSHHRPSSLENDAIVEKVVTTPVETLISKKKLGKQPYRSYLCFDVEATCRGTYGKEFNWPNEIIEFPVVLLQWVDVPDSEDELYQNDQDQEQEDDEHTEASSSSSTTLPPKPTVLNTHRELRIVDTFRTYVRPTWQPVLTEFCVSLTGITQDIVDSSPTFPGAIRMLEEWMDKHGLRNEDGGLESALWVTDGPWDLRDFIPKQLHITPLKPTPHPPYLFVNYLNLKCAFQTVLTEEHRRKEYAKTHPNSLPNARAKSRISTGKIVGKKFQPPGLHTTIAGMVEMLGLQGGFQGRQHSGLDDATNVARILIALSEKNIIIEPNSKLPHPKNMKTWPWMGKPGEVNFEEWMSGGTQELKDWKTKNGFYGMHMDMKGLTLESTSEPQSSSPTETPQTAPKGPQQFNGHMAGVSHFGNVPLKQEFSEFFAALEKI